MSATVVWFTDDLRLADNRVLQVAAEADAPTIPVYVIDEAAPDAPIGGSRAEAWRDGSLEALDVSLHRYGSRLLVLRGESASELAGVCRTYGASRVVHARHHRADRASFDADVRDSLARLGTRVDAVADPSLLDPGSFRTAAGTPYRVFTAFHRGALAGYRSAVGSAVPVVPPAPNSLAGDPRGVTPSERVLPNGWTPGEEGAFAALEGFVDKGLSDYGSLRDRPDLDGTSRLSPHLAWGELHPGRVLAACAEAPVDHSDDASVSAFTRQIWWREFARHLLHHHPETASQPLDARFDSFPWSSDRGLLDAWKAGVTGFPLVDAGMRQLEAEGWMHNRVRMVVASFLTKDLLIHWREGADWFARRLVDHDEANNVFGWQWTAGSGADAAPYFRVFSPTRQAEKFDPDGTYVRRWLPELASLPIPWIHRPHETPDGVCASAGFTPGVDYPLPIVDHGEARLRALAAYRAIRS